MIIKKLGSVSGGGFPSAAYNERKVAEGVASLVGGANVSNSFLHMLHTLHSVGISCGNDVERYLQDCSHTYGNSRSTRWQLHLALSCKGQEKNQEQLTDMAHSLMNKFGYGKQPYFIYFHRDTDNNHVHILSTRVTPQGTLIPEHNDYRLLNSALNWVLNEDQSKDKERMLAYHFTTEGQLLHIARMFNYKIDKNSDDASLIFYHGGTVAFRIPREEIIRYITYNQQDERRKAERTTKMKQFKAIFAKYRMRSLEVELASEKEENNKKTRNRKEQIKRQNNPDIKRLTNAKGEPLSKEQMDRLNWFISELHSKFGVSIHFQKDRDGVVRGYTLLDHKHKMALNGSEVMKLADLINSSTLHRHKDKEKRKARIYQGDSTLDIYRSVFRAKVDGECIVMTMDEKDYRAVLSYSQLRWYQETEVEKQNDIAIRLAVTCFHREIYNHTLAQLHERYIREQPRSKDFPMNAVRLFKQSNGSWMLAVDLPGHHLRMLLTDEERIEASRLWNTHGVKNEFLLFKERMLQEHLIREQARILADRLHYNKVGIKLCHTQKKDGIQVLVAAHSMLMQRLINAFTIGTVHGQGNREWEVGNYFCYDDIDDERKLKR